MPKHTAMFCHCGNASVPTSSNRDAGEPVDAGSGPTGNEAEVDADATCQLARQVADQVLTRLRPVLEQQIADDRRAHCRDMLLHIIVTIIDLMLLLIPVVALIVS